MDGTKRDGAEDAEQPNGAEAKNVKAKNEHAAALGRLGGAKGGKAPR